MAHLGDGEHEAPDNDVISNSRNFPGLAAKIARQSPKLLQVVLVHLMHIVTRDVITTTARSRA